MIRVKIGGECGLELPPPPPPLFFIKDVRKPYSLSQYSLPKELRYDVPQPALPIIDHVL
jgi:hypothetical protein